MDSVGLFDRREWWRPLTALFLHADAVHLLGNLTFGLWYGSLVNRALGTLLGWGLVLLSGVLGNLLVAAIHYPQPHLSLGASTAVFGALGLLVAEGLIHRWQQRWLSRLAPLMVPLVAGGVLLGLTGGFDNPQTDGMAHVMGFLTGIVLGLIACCLQRPSNKAHLTSD
jgi:membrane associated rhomboid family serine protease